MSHFKLTAPCDDCPFRRDGGIRLTRGRAAEIADLFLDAQGGSFPCHKTVDYSQHEDGPRSLRSDESICAGGLAFAQKQGRANQFVRIMERLGAYDASKLRGLDLVFDSRAEMLNAQPRRRQPIGSRP